MQPFVICYGPCGHDPSVGASWLKGIEHLEAAMEKDGRNIEAGDSESKFPGDKRFQNIPYDLELPLDAGIPWDDGKSDMYNLGELCKIVSVPVVLRVLRPYFPNAKEQADAELFAENVRRVVGEEYNKLHMELHGWSADGGV